MNNKLISVTLSVLFCFSLIAISCSKDETSDTTNPPGSNTLTAAPAFDLKAVSGETVKLSDYKNKVVVLFFFGNTCPSCKAVVPDIQNKLVNTYGTNSNFVLLGLDQWDGNPASVQAFKSATGATFPLLLMASPVAKLYGTTYDRFVIINKDGKIAFSGKQLATNDLDAVKAEVANLLN